MPILLRKKYGYEKAMIVGEAKNRYQRLFLWLVCEEDSFVAPSLLEVSKHSPMDDEAGEMSMPFCFLQGMHEFRRS